MLHQTERSGQRLAVEVRGTLIDDRSALHIAEIVVQDQRLLRREGQRRAHGQQYHQQSLHNQSVRLDALLRVKVKHQADAEAIVTGLNADVVGLAFGAKLFERFVALDRRNREQERNIPCREGDHALLLLSWLQLLQTTHLAGRLIYRLFGREEAQRPTRPSQQGSKAASSSSSVLLFQGWSHAIL